METDSIECITSIDGMEEDEIQQSIHYPGSHHHLHPHHHQQFSSSKGHANNGVGVVSPGIIPSTTRVHELLECLVCTNSMYPPIYQVFHCFGQYLCLHFEAFQLGMSPVYMAFLRFMGDEMEARNYSYSLEVGGNGRKLIWEGPYAFRDCSSRCLNEHGWVERDIRPG
ncbi:hypothetical protein MLD38_024845 [Melastoma candidum]|uniref:Uncharacterized protein n=1 Tax=Melastoma candidum TaxID=119954 RepID=A0ACB9NUW2_9MYRT|nr:hypothetical protein MLD38_024845 [Melastoma candidum]